MRELPTDERRTLLLKIRWEMARNDPLEFFKWFCFSLDQHHKEQPLRPFPWERPHIQNIARLFHAVWNRELQIAHPQTGEMVNATGLVADKCRQMFLTWLGCGFCLWDILFHSGRLVFMQSKREEDAIGEEYAATGLLGRCKFILRHIPGLEIVMPQLNIDKHLLTNKIILPWSNSTLWALPEGGDTIRSHTPSGLFTDEAAFQPRFGDAYAAATAGLRGGGWLFAVSTANPSEFMKICEDRIA